MKIDLNIDQPITGSRKIAQIQSVITEWGKTAGVGAKLPTMKELCRELNVAAATLNSALNGLEEQGVITRKHGHGIYISSGLFQRRVALVVGINAFSAGASSFYSMLLRHCEKRAQTHNERFSFYLDMSVAPGLEGQAHPVHADLVDALDKKLLDGLIVSAAVPRPDDQKWLSEQGIPVVAFQTFESPSIWRGIVSIDWKRFMELAVDSLLERGCKSLGLVGVDARCQQFYEQIMRSRGLPCREEWVWVWRDEKTPFSREHEHIGSEAAWQYLTNNGWSSTGGVRPNMPDGIIVIDDLLARGFLPVLSRLGMDIGRDVQIATHANTDSTALFEWEDRISQIEVDPTRVAESLFTALEGLIDSPQQEQTIIRVPPDGVMPVDAPGTRHP
ncbi:MAG: substrate-binding domain-containing protein [Puniceicoccales bacterium]